MSKFAKTLFGGADRSAQRATQAQNEQARSYIEQQLGQGRNYLAGAFDLYSGALPQQINALNQGYGAAQAQLLSGLPVFQNAIMGGPVDFAAYAAQTPITQIQYDPAAFQRPAYLAGYVPPAQAAPQTVRLPFVGDVNYG